jgi:hypothetical protein
MYAGTESRRPFVIGFVVTSIFFVPNPDSNKPISNASSVSPCSSEKMNPRMLTSPLNESFWPEESISRLCTFSVLKVASCHLTKFKRSFASSIADKRESVLIREKQPLIRALRMLVCTSSMGVIILETSQSVSAKSSVPAPARGSQRVILVKVELVLLIAC